MDNVNQDYYELIGLPRSASQAEIDEACIRLAKKYHPDNNIGDPLAAKQFALIETAYESLGNPLRRAAYDFRLNDTEIQETSPFVRAAEGNRSKNYFTKHWNGELSLPVSYWLNMAILASLGPIIFTSVFRELGGESLSLRIVATFSVLQLIFWFVVYVWGIVGVWRSAENHPKRGGSQTWATLAKVAVVLGTISTANYLNTTFTPQIKEFSLIALGQDPMGEFKITLSSDGKSAAFVGILREGAASEITKILDAAPAVTTLVLSSRGGRLAEGKWLAEYVRIHSLDTYVESYCLSACTFIFLSGRDRAATPAAKIGFHAPSFPGDDAAVNEAGRQYAIGVYRAAGLSEQFIQRALQSKGDDLWYPSRDELIQARVLTRVSFGGETTTTFGNLKTKQELALAMRQFPLYVAMESRFPELFAESLEQGWSTKVAGGSDAAVMNAMRGVATKMHPLLRSHADDESIIEYGKLVLGQVVAVRKLGGDACKRFLNSQLDITAVLPKEHSEREFRWLLAALTSQSLAQSPKSPAVVRGALNSALMKVPENYIPVVIEPQKFLDQPDLRCDSLIALYSAVLSLPRSEMAAALSGLLQ